MSDIQSISAQVDGQNKTFTGRMAWALAQLLGAGASGVTPITHPGPRWSDYIMKLRREGVDIETITEAHGGAYAGHHARYVLRSLVLVNEERQAA